MSEVRTVGVIGAGQMGTGIAQVCALAGFDVVLYDVSFEQARQGVAKVQAGLDRQVAGEKIAATERDEALARLKAADGVNDLAPCDLVIEAATEKEEIKRRIFAQVCPCCGRTRFWPPTPPPSRSRGWPPAPTGPSASSAFIS